MRQILRGHLFLQHRVSPDEGTRLLIPLVDDGRNIHIGDQWLGDPLWVAKLARDGELGRQWRAFAPLFGVCSTTRWFSTTLPFL